MLVSFGSFYHQSLNDHVPYHFLKQSLVSFTGYDLTARCLGVVSVRVRDLIAY